MKIETVYRLSKRLLIYMLAIFMITVIGKYSLEFYIRHGDPLNTVIVENKITMFRNNLPYELQLSKDIDKILNEIINNDMNEHEKAKAINDYIVTHVKYERDKNIAYIALKEGQGNCASFAYLAYKMYKKAGIESKIIYGSLINNNGFHSWNLIKLDDKWFHNDLASVSDLYYHGKDYAEAYQIFTGSSDIQFKKQVTWKEGAYPKSDISYYSYLEEKARKFNDKNAINLLEIMGYDIGL